MSEEAVSYRFSGKKFSAEEISLIREIVATCGGLSRMELANTISELLEWRRPGGGLKGLECLAVLEHLEKLHLLTLPEKQRTKPAGSATSIPHTTLGEPGAPLVGQVDEFAPVVLDRVQYVQQRRLFRELIGRYHYLGYAVPFGARLQYLISVSKPALTVVGCLQFSSAAWRMRARDAWIGWDDATRARHLTQVVSNSRFLLAPWVRIKNLASTVLALGLRRLLADWQSYYGVTPLLVETLIDPAQYTGGCYRAANWIELGETSGRGRDDREHRRHGVSPKRLWVYPLTRDAIERLRRGP
ncbi:MAG TPA: Druantia anti-phage system protein DruA [Acidobacteriota bacterium]|nr:Druantia anti-phage system protein DruA [Acidobacteriota bacterium]